MSAIGAGDVVIVIDGPEEEIGLIGRVVAVNSRDLWPIDVDLRGDVCHFNAPELRRIDMPSESVGQSARAEKHDEVPA